VVAGAKILLPLAALALMSTVFLLAREPTGAMEIPYARLEEIARDPRADRVRLAGVTSDGTVVALSSARVTPPTKGGGAYRLEAPRLETEGEDGRATLAAATGEVDPVSRTLRIAGEVRIESSAGYVVETPQADADLSAGTLVTGPVAATAPLGEIEAGRLEVVRPEGEGARLVFNGGVRVLYQPGPPPQDEAP
jgi:lipopolysaccharide export system protein LptC